MIRSPLVPILSACLLIAATSCKKDPPPGATPEAAATGTGDPGPATLPDATELRRYLEGFDGLVDGLRDETTAAKTAWAWFLALNEPSGNGVTWETTFQQDTLIYLPRNPQTGKVDQPTWQPVRPPPEPVRVKAQEYGMDLDKPFHELAYDQQSDGKTLVSNFHQTNVRYQVLINKPGFDYIVANGIYSRDGQIEAAQKHPFDFPAKTWELKTSWIWVPADAGPEYDSVKQNYYLVNAWWSFEDPTTLSTAYKVGYAAMTGMHIINKSVPQWVWVTFENTNDTQNTQVQREPGATPNAEFNAVNATYRAALAQQGSVLQHYEAIGLQTQFTTDGTENGPPTILANTQIESAFQDNSSCISCHRVASIAASGPDKGSYWNVVDPGRGALNYYVGNPPVDQIASQGYVFMDSVWSLQHAK